jgi:hypothetical protein
MPSDHFRSVTCWTKHQSLRCSINTQREPSCTWLILLSRPSPEERALRVHDSEERPEDFAGALPGIRLKGAK